MRKIITIATAAFLIGGIATGAVLSQAQPASPSAAAMDDSPQGASGWGHHRMHEGMMHHHGFDRRTFALLYRQEDRQLAPADVQKIAEAFLLWNGNHTWKVSDVAAATTGGPIGFSLTTPEGSVVAKFTMDPHTGHIQRVG